MTDKRSLTVAALQIGLHPKDEKRALQEGMSFVKSASNKSARLICFPEHWLIEKVLEPGDETYGTFSDLARENEVYINLGGVFEKTDQTFFVSPTISPRGEIISKQAKVHLFRRETKLAIGGDSFSTFEIDGIKTGTMVCHDVVFPESARTLVLRGAEFLLNPSLITSAGIEPWRIYLMARVLENRVPIVAPNPYLPRRVPGNSLVLGMKYEKKQGIMQVADLAKPSSGKKVIISKIIFDDNQSELRKERLSERKPSAYKI
jgi:predicted amidohydrolase